MEIPIDKESAVPIYLQISGGIREMVLSGRLPGGFRLPPERTLARSLGVNRSTVLCAYRELKSGGLADAHVGRGTVVLAPDPGARKEIGDEPSTQPLAWRRLARAGVLGERDPLVRNLLELTENRDLISLSIGLPAPELLPMKTLGGIAETLLADPSTGALLHSPTEGVTAFRETLSELMTRRGMTCSVPEILVTSGSQQGLDLMVRAFVDPGDTIVVEEPTYFGALTAFRGAGARLLGVPTDRDGMRTDVLETLLSRHRPKLIYTLPTFQNPSGSVLSLERRRHLLQLAYRHEVPVLEDDPYSELRYDGQPLPSLKALDTHDHVVYLSSFSKVLFPGLRLGWLAGPRHVVRMLALVKQMVDLHSSTFGQRLVDQFIRAGHFSAHVGVVRAEYARRRDVMLEALRGTAAPRLTWSRPEGGFYVWCRLPEAISQSALLAEAARQGVSFLPGAACFVEDPGESHIRLNFSASPPGAIREGVARLLSAVRTVGSERGVQEREEAGTQPIV